MPRKRLWKFCSFTNPNYIYALDSARQSNYGAWADYTIVLGVSAGLETDLPWAELRRWFSFAGVPMPDVGTSDEPSWVIYTDGPPRAWPHGPHLSWDQIDSAPLLNMEEPMNDEQTTQNEPRRRANYTPNPSRGGARPKQRDDDQRGGARPNAGRLPVAAGGHPNPPIPEPRDQMVRVRLTAREYDSLRQTAAAAGITVSDYIRLLLNSGHRGKRITTPAR